MTKEAAMAKEKEVRPEDILRDLVCGRREDVPAEGIPGVRIVYQSGPTRIHEAQTKGPTVITPERNVLVDCELEAGGIVIPLVAYGYGPRRWRFASQTAPPSKKKAPPASSPRVLRPGEVPGMLGSRSGARHRYAET